MSRSYLRLIAAIGLGFATSIACADEAEVVYYDIVGNNAKELRRELGAEGPRWGKRDDRRWPHELARAVEFPIARRRRKAAAFTEFVVNVAGEIRSASLGRGRKSFECPREANGKAMSWRYVFMKTGITPMAFARPTRSRHSRQSFRVSGSCSTIGQLFNDAGRIDTEQVPGSRRDVRRGHRPWPHPGRTDDFPDIDAQARPEWSLSFFACSDSMSATTSGFMNHECSGLEATSKPADADRLGDDGPDGRDLRARQRAPHQRRRLL